MSSGRKYEISFFTATILEWKMLLSNDSYKDIIVGSLKYLVENKKIRLYAYVIMNNHCHLLWTILPPFVLEEIQRDFLKYTAQMILKDLRNNNRELLEDFLVRAKDRKYQIWERNPLTVEIWSEEVLKQKLNYIHLNPLKAGLCLQPEEYQYSSASFYHQGTDAIGFLTSCLM